MEIAGKENLPDGYLLVEFFTLPSTYSTEALVLH